MKKLILLSLSIFTTTVFATMPVVPTQEFPDDWNPYVEEGIECSQIDEMATPAKPCCSGLDKGAGGICVEGTIVDPGLTGCSSDSQCSLGTACMPLSSKQLFSKVSPSWNQPEFAEEEMALNIQLSDVERIKNVGDICTHPKECSSYNCLAGRCVEKKVCRYADLNESPSKDQKCGAGYVLTNGICDRKPEEKYPAYNTLLNDITYSSQAGVCSSFQMDAVSELESKKSLKHIRALEWMFMSNTVHPDNDCFNLTAAIKEDILQSFYNDRKVATEVLAKEIGEIETDIWTLAHAKDSDDEIVTIHGTESMTGKELNQRMASGNDALLIMIRRNSAFIKYETEMFRILEDASKKFTDMSKKMSSWTDDQGSWDLGTRKTGGKECSARYRIWKPISWRTKLYGNTTNRWGIAYAVGTIETVSFPYTPAKIKSALVEPQKTLFKQSIAEPLAEILNLESVDELKKTWSRPFYLLDPVMHGGTYFGSYGNNYTNGHKGFLGLGKRDIHPMRISPDLAKIHQGRKTQLLEYYKAFRNNASTTAGIFYEPELAPMEAKDCLVEGAKAPTAELEAARKAACEKFDTYLGEVLDISMAQFLAYSMKETRNYSNYFNVENTGRMRLLSATMGRMGTLKSYYAATVEMQKKQNECLSEVISGLKKDGIVTDGQGGVQEGNYYDPGLVPGDFGSGSPGPTKLKPSTGGGKLAAGGNMSSGLSKNFLNGSNGQFGSTGSSTNGNNNFGKGQSDSQFGLFNASKNKDLVDKNNFAQSKGVKIAGPKKEYAEAVASLDKNSQSNSRGGGGGAGASGSNSQSSMNGFGGDSSASRASSGSADEMGGSEALNGNSANQEGSLASTGLNSGAASGSSYGNAGQSASEANASVSQLADQTGMSEEEKNQMMTVYDRNKQKYASDGDDGIFEKVSKAYVRNLEKILIRKKEID